MLQKKPLFSVKKQETEDDKKYTSVIGKPQYLPKREQPPITALYDTNKYKELIFNINNSNVSEDEKMFLKLAASRHIVFNYANIADYYAHATPEMQRLMEQSALVILDIDDAIANNYIVLSKRMEELRKKARQTKD